MSENVQIVAPIARELLLSELTENNLLRRTNKCNNEIYCFTAHECPNLMKEVGRLREMAFRAAGGGTGKGMDIDEYDTAEIPYYQLVVWSPADKEILGGYRYIVCKDAEKKADGELKLATNHMFVFSDKFKKEYLPYTLELGRSFVHPDFQSSNKDKLAKSIFVLDNLWDGLGALFKVYPDMKYFFGKITMYPHYHNEARILLAHFFKKYFSDEERLVYPEEPMPLEYDREKYEDIFTGETYKENYKILSHEIRSLGEKIPPLFNAYMNLSPSMKHFGTAINKRFGNVQETAILLTIADIYEAKKKRHLSSYIPTLYFKLPKNIFSKKKY
ncbi:acetyltransferase (GNAT) family protein [Balneicella halophila]|uniref:Acetyltransferase (GNAT) family protein n=1 Tax=Balneicella halophila TaxID=1537566 RepID=A0A7L4UPB7_BALHA|nr:GNAT family N-acetyltransferase [Balneicella halophila]PVX50975.1 acetyltransferase (GNAT) family protein [Balneicella halophila]